MEMEWMQLRDKILEFSQKAKVVDGAGSALELMDPNAAIFVEPIRYIASVANELRLDAIVKGLKEENNVEMRLNQLCSYVSDAERAFFVSECFRKASISSSRYVCCIMGLMLGDIANS